MENLKGKIQYLLLLLPFLGLFLPDGSLRGQTLGAGLGGTVRHGLHYGRVTVRVDHRVNGTRACGDCEGMRMSEGRGGGRTAALPLLSLAPPPPQAPPPRTCGWVPSLA